jgi:hypothetical protein
MAQLTFPIVVGELLVDVSVNLHAPALVARRAANLPAPQFVTAQGILDTGSDISGVAPAILQQLGLTSYAQTQTQGVGGSVTVDLFRVSLSIGDATQPHLTKFVLPDLVVMELPPDAPLPVLIGMDVLLQCRLLLDGPGRQFTLDF